MDVDLGHKVFIKKSENELLILTILSSWKCKLSLHKTEYYQQNKKKTRKTDTSMHMFS